MRFTIAHDIRISGLMPGRRQALRLRLTPVTFEGQSPERWAIAINGSPVEPLLTDGFANVTTVWTGIPADGAVAIAVNGVVATDDRAGLVRGLPRCPAEVFLRPTAATRADRGLTTFAKEIAGASVLDRLHRLSNALHQRFAPEDDDDPEGDGDGAVDDAAGDAAATADDPATAHRAQDGMAVATQLQFQSQSGATGSQSQSGLAARAATAAIREAAHADAADDANEDCDADDAPTRHACDFDRWRTPESAVEAFAAETPQASGYAHMFIAAARSLRIPARAAWGYRALEDGEAELTVWAEAFVADLGWIAFDPRNKICPTDRYVRLTCGHDTAAAVPLRVHLESEDDAFQVRSRLTVTPAETKAASA